MDVLIVRHAPADDGGRAGLSGDRDRPLTHEGIREFRRVAGTLGRIVPRVNAVFCSPLLRARQTARVLHEAAGWPEPIEENALEPGRSPSDLLPLLRKARRAECIVLVGHEPAMHEAVSYLLSGSAGKIDVEMKKGGSALLEFTGEPKPGSARLRWLFPPLVIAEPPE